MSWRIRQSGVQVPEQCANDLHAKWSEHLTSLGQSPPSDGGEVTSADSYREGAVVRVSMNRYERNSQARASALAAHGTECKVCGMNFESVYGAIGRGYIHVHHLKELSDIGEEYKVDPVKDLVPVCPNCHAMLHKKRPALTPAQLRRKLRSKP
jgi:5-methylcytosine-specific restriction protein A